MAPTEKTTKQKDAGCGVRDTGYDDSRLTPEIDGRDADPYGRWPRAHLPSDPASRIPHRGSRIYCSTPSNVPLTACVAPVPLWARLPLTISALSCFSSTAVIFSWTGWSVADQTGPFSWA